MPTPTQVLHLSPLKLTYHRHPNTTGCTVAASPDTISRVVIPWILVIPVPQRQASSKSGQSSYCGPGTEDLDRQSNRHQNQTQASSQIHSPNDGVLRSFISAHLPPIPSTSQHFLPPLALHHHPLLTEYPLLLGTGLLASAASPVQIPKGSQAGQDNEKDTTRQSHSQACHIHSSTPCREAGKGSHCFGNCYPP